jgi:transcriptional regulator with XRE-family HTH domain
MTNHSTAERVAAEVRAQMARQRKTQGDLAEALGISEHTAGRRMRALVPFDVVELERIALWLDVPVATLWGPGDTPTAVAG